MLYYVDKQRLHSTICHKVMKKLYAPWRSAYTERVHAQQKNDRGCIFCSIIASDNDAQEFVLKRAPHTIVMLNKYPYNPGHILIVPYTHSATLGVLTAEVRGELIEQAQHVATLFETALRADGCNMGINIGKAAGAGIPEHIHMHMLPRFWGDTNFLPTLADTKQVSIDLHELYERLLSVF